MPDKQRIALFIPSLHGGGAERVMLNLAQGFVAEGRDVDLVLVKAEGVYLKAVPDTVNVIDLNCGRVLTSLFKLAVYLHRQKPKVLLSAMDHANIVAILARIIAASTTKIAVSVHSTLSVEVEKSPSWRGKIIPWFINRCYPKADAVITVSTGVADDLANVTRLQRDSITVVYNPVVTPELLQQSMQPIEHQWFLPCKVPVLLAVGRLSEPKDFRTLIKAFAIIKKQRKCRLLILGEGEQRQMLEQLVKHLNLQNEVLLPGFVDNPYAYMKQADVFVLSSAWEGLVTVLIEAMACGTPVVSTDCPSGSSEILQDGKFGRLVPVGDAKALAAAVLKTLDEPLDAESLQLRANDFSMDNSVQHYLQVLDGEA